MPVQTMATSTTTTTRTTQSRIIAEGTEWTAVDIPARQIAAAAPASCARQATAEEFSRGGGNGVSLKHVPSRGGGGPGHGPARLYRLLRRQLRGQGVGVWECGFG